MKEDTLESNLYILEQLIQGIIDNLIPCKYRKWYLEQDCFEENINKFPRPKLVNIMGCHLGIFDPKDDVDSVWFCVNCKKREKGDL